MEILGNLNQDNHLGNPDNILANPRSAVIIAGRVFLRYPRTFRQFFGHILLFKISTAFFSPRQLGLLKIQTLNWQF